MHDIKFIREQTDLVQKGLEAKNVKISLTPILAVDKARRELSAKVDVLRAQVNAANEDIGRMRKNKEDATEKIASMKSIAAEIDAIEPKIKELEAQIHDFVIGIPNIPHASVIVGPPDLNKEVRQWGQAPKFDFKPKTHMELVEELDIIDFKRATKLTGSNFILYKNEGALMERALYNFMLDLHTREHGYKEVAPPVVVNAASMTGTGQLPKMKEDMYHVTADDLYLIPTAEVPVTNIYRDDMLNEEELPIYLTAYTVCFRREAGSYGKDTRGLIRVHQFDKVELVKFVKPETSYDELESLVKNAETVFQKLEIPYRVLQLASGDLSFAAAKCYDLEVYAAGLDKWLEASSCSNFEDFQARRANIRFKGKEKKPAFVHTLNGSGVALPRTMVALIENNQTKEGEIIIPQALRPYMGGMERIAKKKR